MTLPSILSNQRKKVAETRLAKFYSVVNQAILMSEVDNGPKEYWEVPSTELSNIDWYNKYLNKYIKTLKVEESSINTQNRKIINIYFADGSAVSKGNTWLFYPEAKKLGIKTFGDDDATIYADTQTSGKDWFTFVFDPNSTKEFYNKKGLEPYLSGWNGTEENLRTNPSYGCRPTVSGLTERAFCAALIKQNGWKIPDDYPLKF